MLQFWKKSDRKQKEKQNCTNGSPKISNLQLNSTSKLQEEIQQINVQNGPYVPRSRLSKTLAEVLTDKDALGYFIQFMDSRSALALIKFWLDVESFRSASEKDVDALLSPEDYSVISNVSSIDLNSPNDHDDVFETLSHDKNGDTEDDTNSLVNNDCTKNYTDNHDNLVEGHGQSRTQNGDCNMPNNRTRNNHKRRLDSLQSDDISAISTDCDSLYMTADSENENKAEQETNEMEDENPIFQRCHRKLGSVQSLHTDYVKNHNQDNITDAEINGIENHKYSQTTIKRTFSVPKDFDNMKRTISTLSMTNLRKRKDLYSSILQDAVKISKKYICDNAPHFIKLPDHIKLEILQKLRTNYADSEIFTEAQQSVFAQIEQNYFTHFLRSDFNTKHQIDILTSGKVILEDVLFNELALFHFMEYLEQESVANRDLIEFWLSAVNFRQTTSEEKIDSEQLQNDAMTLYDKYFSLQAMNPLHLGDEVRFHVEQNICRENGQPPALTSFDLPLKIVQSYLERNYLKPFLMSQLFFKYLNELINSIHTNPWPRFMSRHRRTGSDASSEISLANNSTTTSAIQQNNKNFANKNNKNQRDSKTFDMTIETSNMIDPDSLWRRKRSSLIFGRVDELGRFRSDLEREPDRSGRNWRLSKAVKRFVNRKDDVTKEEIAWQVAEMIVKDITSLTMNCGAGSDFGESEYNFEVNDGYVS